MKINTIYPVYNKKYGAGSACQAIVENMIAAGGEVSFYCLTCDPGMRRAYHRLTMLPWMKSLGYKVLSAGSLVDLTEWRYVHSIFPDDLAYIWPGTSLKLFEAVRHKGNVIVTENINTHQATSKALLDEEYSRLGLVPDHRISQKNIDDENAKLALVDFVFSPSPEVTKSLLAANVEKHRIIDTSYGLDEESLLSEKDITAKWQQPHVRTALFVGRIGIRKGVHLLLKYWVEANVDGMLQLVGNIEDNARHLIEPYLGHPRITHIPFTQDLKSLYRQADVFLFPSLEEGSPLVTYLALGAGLPALVSPMGGGGIIEHAKEGLVIEPHDGKAWIEAIQTIFSDATLRARLSGNARNKAPEYLWQNVGRKRYFELRVRIQAHAIKA